MQQTPLIEIILGTYDGEQYIREQLSSLMTQTYPNIKVLIGDDASFDSTPQILEEFKQKYPDKIQYILFKENVGIVDNYSRLLELSEAPYLMFADQDDVWFADKVSKLFKKMKELESQWGSDVPLLVNSDAVITDMDLNVIAPSLWKYHRLSEKKGSQFNYALVKNWINGCTMMFNRVLADLATPIPLEGHLHDIWFTLLATGLGHLSSLNEPMMYYRQHENNRFGALKIDFGWFLERIIKSPECFHVMETSNLRSSMGAYVFYKRYGSLLSKSDQEMVKVFVQLRSYPFWKEMWYRFRYRFFFHTFWKNVILVLTSLYMGKHPPKYHLDL